jgi:adenosine deaminase
MRGAERFRALPKAELHAHLDGSLRPATLLELAAREGVTLPAADPASLRRVMRVDDARNLDDYLARFAITVAVLQDPAAIERVAYEMALDAAADGCRYLEVRYCPALSLERGLTLDEVIAAERRGLLRGEAETGIRTAIINCSLRHLDPATSVAIAEASVRLRRLGVVAFDIAGGEASFPAAPHAEAFRVAARGGLAITVHAGEAAGPDSVWEALIDCRANRIGHGTRLGEDPTLLAYVRDRRIPVEACITSNVQTRVVPDPARHPLRRYLDEGLVVTLGSDNWLMSDVTLSGEYALAEKALGLSNAECRTLLRNGFASAFLPFPEREKLLASVTPALEQGI